MNKLILFSISFLMGLGGLSAQFSENAEQTQGSRSVMINQCWTMWGWDVKPNDAYSGVYVIRSGQQNNPNSPARLFTPFLSFSGTGSIDFTHALNAANGTFRELKVYLVDVQGIRTQTLLTYTYRNANANANGNPTLAQAASIPVNFNGIFRVEWELNGDGGNSRGLLDDIVVSATYATDPTDCSPLQLCADADNDGVCDGDDDYPNDPSKAYAFSTGVTTWAFEDLYPIKGDYDFNDLVAKVDPVFVTNANNEYVSIEMTTTIEAIGSGFANGLGLRFLIPGSTISMNDVTVSGSVLNGKYANILANGAEAGHGNELVVIVAERARDIASGYSGPFFRTMPGIPMGSTTPINIVIDFNNPLTALNVLYEYFLIKEANRGVEIHIPGVGATALVDPLLFAQPNSDINPAPWVFYKTYDNLPWAMHLAGDFDWPREKVDITQAYSKFASWAQSGGLVDQDWYTNLAERDPSKIY